MKNQLRRLPLAISGRPMPTATQSANNMSAMAASDSE